MLIAWRKSGLQGVRNMNSTTGSWGSLENL